MAYLGERRFRGNLMVPFTAGGYGAWKLALEVLGRYPADAVLVPVEAPVGGTLRRLPGWRRRRFTRRARSRP